MTRLPPSSRSKPPTRASRPPQRPSLRRTAPAPLWRRPAIIAGAIGIVLVLLLAILALRAGGQATLSSDQATATAAPTSVAIEPSAAPAGSAPLAAATSAAGSSAVAVPPDIPALQELMLQLINDDRRANGQAALTWDSTAATAGLRHAEEMARFGYLSHLNLDGYGPDYRYSLAGGMDSSRENIYQYEHSGPGSAPASADEWQQRIREAQQALMQSPGHRDNILAPAHTHVGVGIAYDSTAGRLSIAQEFVDRYVALQPLARRASLGGQVTVAGRLGPGASNPVLNLAYEPLPAPKSVADLNATGTYESPAQNYDSAQLVVDGEGRFSQAIALNKNGQAGLYHVRVWVDTAAFGKVQAADVVVEVR